MIRFLVAFKRKCPWVWDRVEDLNGLLFRLRYRNMGRIAESVLDQVDVASCRFSLLEKAEIPALEALLAGQPEGYFAWFAPHRFDRDTLERLFRNPAFLMMKVTAPDGSMTGYFFLRCFFIGRAFAGLMVDRDWQNRGIGTAIWAASADICGKAGLRMQATMSSENIASIASCRKGTDYRTLQALEDHYFAVECKRKA